MNMNRKAGWLFAAVSLFCGGCDLPQTQYSAELTESGTVQDTVFAPKGRGSDTTVGFNTGNGGGVTITPVNITIPERYAIVLECERGKFVIDGKTGKRLYQTLKRGDNVTIRYREVYRVTKTETNLVGLYFVDATKRTD